jgi:hypothetical protein
MANQCYSTFLASMIYAKTIYLVETLEFDWFMATIIISYIAYLGHILKPSQ